MPKAGSAFWRAISLAEAIGAAYALVESLLSEGPAMIGDIILPPGLLNGIYVFLIALGICGFALLNWSWISTQWGKRLQNKLLLRANIEEAFNRARRVCEPEILNPERQGNPAFHKAEARDFINMHRPALRKAGLAPPEPCTLEDESFREWFDYLANIRARDEWVDLMPYYRPRD